MRFIFDDSRNIKLRQNNQYKTSTHFDWMLISFKTLNCIVVHWSICILNAKTFKILLSSETCRNVDSRPRQAYPFLFPEYLSTEFCFRGSQYNLFCNSNVHLSVRRSYHRNIYRILGEYQKNIIKHIGTGCFDASNFFSLLLFHFNYSKHLMLQAFF